MKELTIEDVSPKAISSAKLWLWAYLAIAKPQDEDYEHDEWNHSDGWDLNLYHCGNTVRVLAHVVKDGYTDGSAFVCVAEGTITTRIEDDGGISTDFEPLGCCERCGEETPNGAGHYQDELGTEERICGECYKKEMSERMGINKWVFAFADLASEILRK